MNCQICDPSSLCILRLVDRAWWCPKNDQSLDKRDRSMLRRDLKRNVRKYAIELLEGAK